MVIELAILFSQFPAASGLLMKVNSGLTLVHYHGNERVMAIAQSKLTAQGQISVPAEIRRKLGITTGGVLEWDENDGQIVVRKAGKYSSEDIHRALFPSGPPKTQSAEHIRQGIRQNLRKRYARR